VWSPGPARGSSQRAVIDDRSWTAATSNNRQSDDNVPVEKPVALPGGESRGTLPYLHPCAFKKLGNATYVVKQYRRPTIPLPPPAMASFTQRPFYRNWLTPRVNPGPPLSPAMRINKFWLSILLGWRPWSALVRMRGQQTSTAGSTLERVPNAGVGSAPLGADEPSAQRRPKRGRTCEQPPTHSQWEKSAKNPKDARQILASFRIPQTHPRKSPPLRVVDFLTWRDALPLA